ncbi:hypothetical protein BGW39_011391 [Mortierella sp. 14UC]|nr:hypothetical protein BGW39_011391 [Mortierella sp. 14UC]
MSEEVNSSNQILWLAPCLKVLDVRRNRMDSLGGALDAMDILQSEWVCNHLEEFGCTIDNIPRPDITREIFGQPARKCIKSGTLQKSVDLQQQVYSKLRKVEFYMWSENGGICDHLGSGLFEAHSKHSNTLQVLRFTGEISLESELLNTLLCSTPNLKKLHFLGNISVTHGGWPRAWDIAQSEQACTNLKVFACRIVSINRQGYTDSMRFVAADGKVTQGGTVQESIALQRHIYAQLVRLVSLQVLQLGFIFDEFSTRYGEVDDCHYRQYDGLVMTLESGLDLLKDLKELRVVRLHNKRGHPPGSRAGVGQGTLAACEN